LIGLHWKSLKALPSRGVQLGALLNGDSSEYMMQQDHLPRLLSLEETAEVLRLSTHTVRALVRKGKLHPVRITRRLLFDAADIATLIKG